MPLPLRIILPFMAVTERTEQQNFTTAERRYGNGRTPTEWWKLLGTIDINSAYCVFVHVFLGVRLPSPRAFTH